MKLFARLKNKDEVNDKVTIYIALLRGINVGGHNMIKMAELKRVLEEMGLKKVKTYIQSGNVLFESEEEEGSLSKRMEEVINQAFGLSVPVVLRTSKEWDQIIKFCPYRTEGLQEGESVQIAFLGGIPSQKEIERLNAYQSDKDEFKIIDKNLYLYFRQSIRDSKLAANLSKLDVPATVRNWKTVIKLSSMAQDLK